MPNDFHDMKRGIHYINHGNKAVYFSVLYQTALA